MRKKFILLSFLIACAAPLLQAQTQAVGDSSPWAVRMVKKGFHLLVDPSPKLDSAYVYQMPLRWAAGVDGTLIGITSELHAAVKETALPGGSVTKESYSMDFALKNHPCFKVGGSFGYGGLSAGYGVEVGKKGESPNKYFSFGLSGDAGGVQIQNYKVHEFIEKSGGPYGRHATSTYPGHLKDFAVDAYYVFNNRRFIYGSAYKGTKIQRRSVGSWMISGRYLQGDLSVDDRDLAFLEVTEWLKSYSTQQVSLGGGYSFNWVLFHRDPSDWDKAKGLRNLTMNLTVLPMASFFTHVDSYLYREGADPYRTRFDGKVSFAFQAHAALSYCWDRYSVNVQVHHNRFGFHGADQILRSEDGLLRYDISTRALFQDLTAKVQFYVRF